MVEGMETVVGKHVGQSQEGMKQAMKCEVKTLMILDHHLPGTLVTHEPELVDHPG